MPSTNTYVALKQTTLSTDATSVTFDLSGITGYTDLVLVASSYAKFTSAGSAGLFIAFNGSSAANYSSTIFYTQGTSAFSIRNTGQTRGQVGQIWCTTSSTSTKFDTTVLHINNFSNTTTYKTTIGRSGSGDGIVDTTAMLWKGATGSSTEAITSLQLTTNATTFLAGSTFSLYGLTAQPASVGTAKATGGTIYYDTYGYVYHKFTSTGTFTPSSSIASLEALIVAGGGGGGMIYGGGGGAGGVVYQSLANVSTTRTVTVGGGGSYESGGVYASVNSTNGGDSSVTGFTTAVGGGRATYWNNTATGDGQSGGSGGGGSNPQGTGGAATAGQGFVGGVYRGVGGGGGGAYGMSTGVNGGTGTPYFTDWATLTNSGSNGYYAGGGGGGVGTGGTAGTGGAGGGASGGAGTGSGSNGTSNTGGGGGGGGYNTGGSYGVSGSGGSGIVILRYLGV